MVNILGIPPFTRVLPICQRSPCFHNEQGLLPDQTAGRAVNDMRFLETLFEYCAQVRLVPRNRSTKIKSGTKYKWISVLLHIAWDKLTNPRFNKSICQGYCSITKTPG